MGLAVASSKSFCVRCGRKSALLLRSAVQNVSPNFMKKARLLPGVMPRSFAMIKVSNAATSKRLKNVASGYLLDSALDE